MDKELKMADTHLRYTMKLSSWDLFIMNQPGITTTYEAEELLKSLYGMRQTAHHILSFEYEIFDEKKFNEFLLKFG